MTSNLLMNPTSSYIELAANYDDFVKDESLTTKSKNNYLIENFLNDENNMNNLESDVLKTDNLIKVQSEKPYISLYTNINVDNKIEYEFKCCRNVDSIFDFYLYIPEHSKLTLDDILSIEVYTLSTENDKTVFEEISREFLVCWNRIFKQSIPTEPLKGIRFYLPIFLNRNKLKYYFFHDQSNSNSNLTSIKNNLNFKITFENNLNKNNNTIDTNLDLYLYYQTCIYSKIIISSLSKKYQSKNYYYYFDRVCDYTKTNQIESIESKWFKLDKIDNIKGSFIDINVRMDEPFHRLTDLFILLRYKCDNNNNNNNNKRIIKSFELFLEETICFRLPAEMCQNLLNPIFETSTTNSTLEYTFGKEIKEVYYIPFSSKIELFKEYNPRSYFNTKSTGSIFFRTEFEKIDNLNDTYEISLCYMSPVKIKF